MTRAAPCTPSPSPSKTERPAATIPAAAYEAYPYPYTVSAPRGFVLCSINVPTASTFYQAAHDIVFGFKLDPAPPPSTGPTSTT